jgi:hypothetical protein
MSIPDQSEPHVFGTHNGFEVYPMPMFAVMETADVNALSRWYQAALGFAVMFKAPEVGGQPMLVHLRRRKYQDVLVRPAAPGRILGGADGLSIAFQAGEDIDQLAAHAAAVAALGKAHVGAPADMPWNTREVRIVDPDGRILVLTHPRFDPELTDRMKRMFEADQGKGR